MADRRYSDAEVAAILSRAADLSVEQAPTATSLLELERIGVEAGLAPELIRQAAAELKRGGQPADKPSIWGRLFGRLRLRHETVIPGELGDGGPQALLDAIQHALGLPGALSQAGSSFVWSTSSGPQGGRSVMVHVSSTQGETRIRVEERLGNMAGGIWGGVFGGGGSTLVTAAAAVGAATLGPVGATAAGLGALVLSLGGTRAIYEKAYNGRADQLQALFGAVTDVVSEHATVAAETGSALDTARGRQGVLPAPERELMAATDDDEAADPNVQRAELVDVERQR